MISEFQTQKPVIIIGMHRSGTSLLTDLLAKSGIHLGSVVERNKEAVFFLRINDLLLKKCRSSWNNPFRFDEYFNLNKKEIHEFVKKKMNGFGSNTEYWGRGGPDQGLWGWKDPRNTITLNIWTSFFPEAKIIHIYRNPFDVALSLQKRELHISELGRLRFFYNRIKFNLKYGLRAKNAPELRELSAGFKLWEFYTERALEVGGDILHIRYEDLLETGHAILRKLSDFLSFGGVDFKSDELIKQINRDRSFAFTKNENNQNLERGFINDQLLDKLGYPELKNY